MRQAFIQSLQALAQKDPRVLLLTGDLGFKVFDDFRKSFAPRFLNVGVAESNMIGLAAGLALEGKIPFAYSIVSFLTMRPFEHIRNDICFNNANVKLVGVGGGLSYGPNGPTHHALNDVALMRVLPEMSVICPGDPHEARWAIEAAYRHQGPVYIRLGRAGEPCVHQQALQTAWGQAIQLQDGHDIALLVNGLLLPQANAVASLLSKEGLTVRLLSFPSVKPLDHAQIMDSFNQCEFVFTIEEHNLAGGFGSAVMELANQRGLKLEKLRVIACPDLTIHKTGSHEYLRREAGLTTPQIFKKILGFIKEKASC